MNEAFQSAADFVGGLEKSRQVRLEQGDAKYFAHEKSGAEWLKRPYKVFDSSSASPGQPVATVNVHSHTVHSRDPKHSVYIELADPKQRLGPQGLKAVARMVAKIHPEVKTLSVRRPKAGERGKVRTRPAPGGSVQLLPGSAELQLKDHPNPFAKALRSPWGVLIKSLIITSPHHEWGSMFDYKNLGKEAFAAPQGRVARPTLGGADSVATYSEAAMRTHDTWRSAAGRRRLDAGLKAGGHLWYYMDPLHRAFQDHHGEQEGSRRFNLFMDTISATSHNSEFGLNMRRAGALFPFMLHGHPDRKLSHEEGLNHLLQVGLGNTAHRNMASALQNVRDGKPAMTKRGLKIDTFAPNLRGNFLPVTADRHVFRQTGHEGGRSHIVYQGIEDATISHAANLARRGSLPVAPGRAASGPFQSAQWIGDAITGRVKSPPRPALAEFEHEIRRTAGHLGIHHHEALKRFMDGGLHEFGGGAPGLRPHIKPQLDKALHMKRQVHWVGGSQAKPEHMVEGPGVKTTLLSSGRAARITAGPVKLSEVPKQKRGKLRRVTSFVDLHPSKIKDTDTEKFTVLNDGRVTRTQFFAKADPFQGLRESLG
jgi:hypothetical protein